MLARKFSSLGIRRCPRPWRARKATRFPSRVPTTNASLGSPKGVLTRSSRVLVRPGMEYRPLPPTMPISAMVPFGFVFVADFPLAFFTFAIPCSPALLPVQIHRLDFDFAASFVERGRGDIWIMTEDDDPIFFDDLGNPLSFCFQRLQWIQVVSHDPWQGNMVTGWKQICNKDEGLAAAGEFYGLDTGVVTGDEFYGDTGEDLRGAID